MTTTPLGGGAREHDASLASDLGVPTSHGARRATTSTRSETLLKITAAIAKAVSSEQVFEALVDRVAEAVAASTAALWLIDDERRAVTLARASGYAEPAKRQLDVIPLDRTPSIPLLDSLRHREPVWIPSQSALLERYPHLAAVVTPGRSDRIACLPLTAPGEVLGALAISIEGAAPASDEEREFLLLVAGYASQAIQRLRLVQAERRSQMRAKAAANRLALLSRASRAFADADMNLEPRLRTVTSELAEAFESCVNIALIEPDGLLHAKAARHPELEADEELSRLWPSVPVRVGEGVTGTVAATGQSVLLPSLDAAMIASRAAPAYRAFLERYPVYALISAPLRVRGRVIGTVTATRVRAGETYSQEDLSLLEELAERAAVAIENARLYQETVDARRRAEQLYQFAQAVVAADDVDVVFAAALHAIEAALGVERAAVLTFDDDRVMRFRAHRGLSEPYRSAVEGHSPWPHDAKMPEPVLVPRASSDPALAAYAELFRREDIGALAFIPLVTRGELIGKFVLYYHEPHAFSVHEVETARALANHLASVITRFAVVSKLEETIRHNELFAGVLGHDLRNPLSAIMTAAQLMLLRTERAGVERDTMPLTRILSSGRRMANMINQLLDFTRARSGGGIEIEPRETSLSDLCTQAIDELVLAHPEWRVERRVAGDPRGTWDPDRLLQALSNLLANAGQHGRRDAAISVDVDGSDAEHVRVAIRNEGAIPASLLPHLFDPFRGTRHRRESARGLGLGLFIVREIVRVHGGTVDVSSSELAGTTFSIRLPRRSMAS